MASAETLSDAKASIETVTSDNYELVIRNFSTGQYSVIANLNNDWLQNDFQNLTGNSYLITTSQSKTDGNTINTDITASSGTTLGVYYRGKTYTPIINITASLTENDKEWSSLTGATVSLTASNVVTKGATLYLYLTFDDGTDLTLDSGFVSGYCFTDYNLSKIKVNVTDAISSVYVYDSVLSADSVKSVSGEILNVPEPATATLSLLALGTLALRHRRA